MRTSTIVIGLATTLSLLLIVWWIVDRWPKDPLPVAPNIGIIQNCDSMETTVKIYNPDIRTVMYSYKLYVDTNSNRTLDSSDILVATEPIRSLSPYSEYVGMKIRPSLDYKGYPFIVELITDKLVVYHVSIPCDVNLAQRDSTPTK